MAYLTPCTGFECPVEAIIAMGIFPLSGQINLTKQKRRRNRKNLGGRHSIRIDPGDSVLFSTLGVTGTTHIHIGFLMEFNTGNTTFAFRRDGSTNASIVVTSAGNIELRRGGITLATSIGTLIDDTWHTLEFEVTAQDTGRIRVWVDGSPTEFVDTGVGVDCQVSTTADFDCFTVSAGVDVTVWLDDLLIADNITGRATKPWHVVGLGAGNPGSQQFTPVSDPANWQNVDDQPLLYNPAQYNTSSISGHIDRYLFKNPPFFPTDVLFLQTLAVMVREGNITQVRHTISSNGTVANGANQAVAGAGTENLVVGQFAVDPDTSTVWDRSGLSNVQAGVQIS